LPFELGHVKTLKTLLLMGDDSLKVPPPEVVAQGTEAVLNYLRQHGAPLKPR
jgi:hypothetical protein